MRSAGCRENAPATTFDAPAQVVRGAIQKDKLPMRIRFDADGPFIALEIGQWKADIPLVPAVMQREIYYHGERYWRQWANTEQAAVQKTQEEETKNKRKQLRSKFLIAGAVIAALVVGAVLTVVLTKKRSAVPGASAPAAPVTAAAAPRPETLFSGAGGKLDSINIL